MIGELLRKTRQEQNLTQKQLAEKSGISFVSINRIENGNPPRLSVIEKIFSAMGKRVTINLTDNTEVVG
ncbi:MAG: Helix-turn-helix domain [Bacteroidota bacterium]|jgi:transcriptional regulator with XRE-family HTH domain